MWEGRRWERDCRAAGGARQHSAYPTELYDPWIAGTTDYSLLHTKPDHTKVTRAPRSVTRVTFIFQAKSDPGQF